MGYDPTLSVAEQLAKSREKLAFYLANGHDGTSVVEAVRQQIAGLEHQAALDAAADPVKAAKDAAGKRIPGPVDTAPHSAYLGHVGEAPVPGKDVIP